MSLLPEVRDGVLVTVQIPQGKPKRTKVSKIHLRRLERQLQKESNRRKNKKNPAPFITPKYKDYIKSEAWKIRRAKFFKKYGRECAVCKSTRLVGLHHISYKHVGRELDEELVALCWTHHEAYHIAEGVQQDNLNTHTFIEDERQVIEFTSLVKNL